MSEEKTDELFVEIEGLKYKADPDNPEEALKGEDDKPIPFEEKEDDDDEDEDKKKKKEDDGDDDEDEEPKVRKSAKDFIIERKNKKINKLKKEKKEKESEFSDEGSQEIDDKIQEGLKPFLNRIRGNADDQELKDVFTKYPNAKKMEKTLRKYMDHPAYKDVPISFIYLGLAKQSMDKAERLEEKKKKADEEALGDTTGGNTKRLKKLSKIPDVTGMSDKEVEALSNKIKAGKF